LAPKGKTPDTYDFSELDFFILLSLMEEQLERANIVVEKKELTESRGKLDEIQKELDTIDEKIREQMLAGGGELQEYEEIEERLPGAQALAASLAERVTGLRESLKELDAAKERRTREEDEALAAIDAARKELAKLR
jgi:chromosome segregation ATPase